jgi:hypothetical protein
VRDASGRAYSSALAKYAILAITFHQMTFGDVWLERIMEVRVRDRIRSFVRYRIASGKRRC